jgi:hypothetical protein
MMVAFENAGLTSVEPNALAKVILIGVIDDESGPVEEALLSIFAFVVRPESKLLHQFFLAHGDVLYACRAHMGKVSRGGTARWIIGRESRITNVSQEYWWCFPC